MAAIRGINMNTKNEYLALKILALSEAIISIRVLLFALPVSLSRLSMTNPPPVSGDDHFIYMLTIVSLLYFLAGVTLLLNFKLWKFFHYVAAAVVIILTAVLLKSSNTPPAFLYYVPAVLAVASTVFISVTKKAI